MANESRAQPDAHGVLDQRRLRERGRNLADEMAAELEPDLAEAESEGVSATGSSAKAPRRFAATWAGDYERGSVRC